MELFTKLFGDLLVFVYHCFDRIVIHGYLSGLSRPEQVVYFFRQVLCVPVVSKEVLSQRTTDYQAWVEAFARNHDIPIERAEKGVHFECCTIASMDHSNRRSALGHNQVSLWYCSKSTRSPRGAPLLPSLRIGTAM